MLTLDKLIDKRPSSSSETIKGDWFLIQWSPDPAAQEKYNIGVGFVGLDGRISLKMLDYFDRIKCLYDESMIFHARLACDISYELIISRQSISESLSPNISINTQGFAQGPTIDHILNNLYRSSMPLSHKIRVPSEKKRFVPISRDDAYNKLKDTLRAKLGLSYEHHAPANPFMSIVDDAVPHKLFLPYRKENSVATLASAAYANHQQVKGNLYDGHRDISVAKSFKKSKESAIFFILPGDNLAPSAKISIENEIDTFTWYMSKQGVKVGSHQSIDGLGNEIAEWCEAA